MPSSVRIYQCPAPWPPIIVSRIVAVIGYPTTEAKPKPWRRPVCANVIIHFQLIRTFDGFGPKTAVVNQAKVDVELAGKFTIGRPKLKFELPGVSVLAVAAPATEAPGVVFPGGAPTAFEA